VSVIVKEYSDFDINS